jgi:hypothetical protein
VPSHYVFFELMGREWAEIGVCLTDTESFDLGASGVNECNGDISPVDDSFVLE